MIAQTVTDFVNNEVLPALDRLEDKDWGLARELVRRAGALGLLGVDVPEAYGGLALDKITSMIVSERMSQSASFGATFGAHGQSDDPAARAVRRREAQKRQYLPELADRRTDWRLLSQRARFGIGRPRRADPRDTTGRRQLRPERREGVDHQRRVRRPSTSSSARWSTTRASTSRRSSSSGRFAGVSTGKEEHKMGLHGSSTTPVILAGRAGARRQPARRDRQGPQDRVQRPQLRALQARRDVRRRRERRDRRGRAIRRRSGNSSASRSRRSARSSTRSARWSTRTYAVESLTYRTAGMIDGPHRRHAARSGRSIRGARRRRGVRDRGVDREGGRQRDARFRARREHSDPRRQRVRSRLSGRAALPRFAREPHFRGHQRDQSTADSRECWRAGRPGEPPIIGAGQGTASRALATPAPPQPRRRRRRSRTRRRSTRSRRRR